MNASARNFLLNAAVAIVAVVVSGSALGQLDTPRVTSDLSLVVDGGSEILVIPLITEEAQDEVLTYDLGAGVVRFDAGVIAPEYDEPFFCFDLTAPSSAVSMEVLDPNGHVVIDQFNLNGFLAYSLDPLTLTIDPSSDQQCFYRSSQGVFGLFGMASSSIPEPPGLIFGDRLEVARSLSLEYQDVPSFVTPGQTVSYDLVVSNTGTGALQTTALQELFPENLGVYDAALTGTTWTCSETGGAVCPASSGTGPLRFEEMNSGGSDLAVGGSLTFTIERMVDVDSISGESIRLHAGTVADPLATGTPFAVDEASMTVIGESAGLNVSAPTTQVGDEVTITVTVLDSSQNPVPYETVDVDDQAGLNFTSPTTGDSDESGEVTFTATTESADDYTVSFSSGTLSGSGTVTFEAGPPAFFVAAALDAEAIADGTDSALISVLVEDSYENPVDSVAVEVSDDGGLSSLPGSVFTDINGEASFTPTSTIADTFQIQFSVTGAGTESVSLEFVPGAPSDLVFFEQPSDVAADEIMSPGVVVRVVDENENWVEDDSSTHVQLRLRQNGTTVDSNLANMTVSNGEALFDSLSFDSSQVGSGYTLRAVGTTASSIFFEDSTSFEVTSAQ
ncbi:Ig-like domain-containing protein [Wenzhouxiangella sp. EGI_FJ10409]|uniref:Ig-like domain-containing protein n=1 Tax=Wenzhouxiangella sp. EGI_FJ10409 TaxID=3243767 RepID=UPI0035DB0243